MCGRFAVDKNPEELAAETQAVWDEGSEFLPSWNTCPTSFTPVLCEEKLHSWSWGLIPDWAKDDSRRGGLINARIETLDSKPAFKNLLGARQCIVPVSGYFEWQVRGDTKIPHYIYHKDKSLMLLAGLWDKWIDRQGNDLFTFTIITRDATDNLALIHNRMPMALSFNDARSWSSNDLNCGQLIEHSLTDFSYHEVSSKVNSVRNNSPDLIEPTDNPQMWQGELF